MYYVIREILYLKLYLYIIFLDDFYWIGGNNFLGVFFLFFIGNFDLK